MAFNKTPTGFKSKNKLRRQANYLSQKKTKEAEKRDLRFRRKREEAKDPSLREDRHARNVPATQESKRVWDEDPVGDEEDVLSWAVDVERLAKRRKLEAEAAEAAEAAAQSKEKGEGEGTLAKLKRREQEDEEDNEVLEDNADSMLDSASDLNDDDEDNVSDSSISSTSARNPPPERASSPTTSTATNLELSPEFLKQKFPQLFAPTPEPKILITTSLHSSLHAEAKILTSLFPNSTYIRRSAHAHAHKYSVREIASFASNRAYTALVVLMQAKHTKQPDGLDIITLPAGPHFHFSVSNWVPGHKLPRHASDTGHYPELILNNFKTPVGILTAHLFKGLFPDMPELEGRQVLTLHNQRDYIFVRRHRYVFREKRETEKEVLGMDGKPMKGTEGLRVGMQEIGPRLTLKLRRIDRGIQYKSGQEWQWTGRKEKVRARFNM